jgi:carboxymethylenebutenolidase
MADLSAIFDEHVAAEFDAKSIDATMATMTEEPYVLHVPTLSGDRGAAVRDYYVSNFIGHSPPDTVTKPITRTVSENRVIDEFLFEFTHTVEMPFMLPGVAPTGRKVSVPLVVVMGFEGDKVAYEHIYWDQASVLVQVGLLDPDTLPVKGVEQAETLFEFAGGSS